MVRRIVLDSRRMEKATIITIGDELLIGQVVDTNSAYMAQVLNRWGISVQSILTVHDDAEQIQSALQEAMAETDLVLLTGGLGPTKDDITKATLCRFFDTYLVENQEVKENVLRLYKDRPEVLNRLTETQWQVPQNCTIIQNKAGSAPIMLFRKDGKIVVSMPGVPHEMEYAMSAILPVLQNYGAAGEIQHKTLIVHGLPESALAIRIEHWEDALPPHLHLAYLPKNGFIRLRLSGYAEDKAALEAEMQKQISALSELVNDCLIATEDQPLEVLVGRKLLERNATVSTAESCTGGKVAVLLNKHAGSSAFYMGSVVAYDNRVKAGVLGVCEADLDRYGAVSEPVVRQMAQGARRLLHTDYAVATSGVAGPGGGTEEKPVGTVWIAVASDKGTKTKCLHLGKQREQNTDRTAQEVLLMLLEELDNR